MAYFRFIFVAPHRLVSRNCSTKASQQRHLEISAVERCIGTVASNNNENQNSVSRVPRVFFLKKNKKKIRVNRRTIMRPFNRFHRFSFPLSVFKVSLKKERECVDRWTIMWLFTIRIADTEHFLLSSFWNRNKVIGEKKRRETRVQFYYIDNNRTFRYWCNSSIFIFVFKNI